MREIKVQDPFIDLRLLLDNGALVRTYIRQLLAATTAYSFLYGFTQWLEDARSLSASMTGLILLLLSGAALIVSATTGRRNEIHLKLIFGSLFQIAACIGLLMVHEHTSVLILGALAIVMGLPQGLNNLANQTAVYFQSAHERTASSAGLLRSFAYLGAIAAAAASGGFFGKTATTRGVHELGAFLLVVAVAFFVLSVSDRSLSQVVNPKGERI